MATPFVLLTSKIAQFREDFHLVVVRVEIFGGEPLAAPCASQATPLQGSRADALIRPDGSFDLSDMFKPGVIPKNIPNVRVTVSAVMYNWKSKTATQTITVTNLLSSTIPGPISIALDDLTPGVTLINSNGSSSSEEEESPYITVVPSNSSLEPGASASVTLQFKVPDFSGLAYDVREVFQR